MYMYIEITNLKANLIFQSNILLTFEDLAWLEGFKEYIYRSI